MGDAFRLARDFEASFRAVLAGPAFAPRVRSLLQSDAGLSGRLASLDVEPAFAPARLGPACRTAEGYQPPLVSPERGLRRALGDVLAGALEPSREAVRGVARAVLGAVGEATAALPAGPGAPRPPPPPAVLAAIRDAAAATVRAWAREAARFVDALVAMERECVTAGFFRVSQGRAVRAAAAVAAAAAAPGPAPTGTRAAGAGDGARAGAGDGDGAGGGAGGGDGDGDSSASEAPSEAPSRVSRGAGLFSALSAHRGEVSAALAVMKASLDRGDRLDPGDWLVGALEKKARPEDARRWRWQRRFFVLDIRGGVLYYLGGPEELPRARGAAALDARTVVEDIGAQRVRELPERDQGGMLEQGSGESLVFRLRRVGDGGAVVKGHPQLILRAPSLPEKRAWLARLAQAQARRAGGAGPPDAPPGTPPGPAAAAPSGAPRRGPRVRGFGGLSVPPAGTGGLGACGPEGATLPSVPGPPRPRVPALPPHLGGHGWAGGLLADNDGFLRDAGDTAASYARVALDTLSVTVPKAIVHLLVRRAESGLLDALYAELGGLALGGRRGAAGEDPAAAGRRAALGEAVEDLDAAVAACVALQEGEGRAAFDEGAGGGRVRVPAAVLALASGALADRLRPHGVPGLSELPGCPALGGPGEGGGGGPPRPRRRPAPGPPPRRGGDGAPRPAAPA